MLNIIRLWKSGKSRILIAVLLCVIILGFISIVFAFYVTPAVQKEEFSPSQQKFIPLQANEDFTDQLVATYPDRVREYILELKDLMEGGVRSDGEYWDFEPEDLSGDGVLDEDFHPNGWIAYAYLGEWDKLKTSISSDYDRRLRGDIVGNRYVTTGGSFNEMALYFKYKDQIGLDAAEKLKYLIKTHGSYNANLGAYIYLFGEPGTKNRAKFLKDPTIPWDSVSQSGTENYQLSEIAHCIGYTQIFAEDLNRDFGEGTSQVYYDWCIDAFKRWVFDYDVVHRNHGSDGISEKDSGGYATADLGALWFLIDQSRDSGTTLLAKMLLDATLADMAENSLDAALAGGGWRGAGRENLAEGHRTNSVPVFYMIAGGPSTTLINARPNSFNWAYWGSTMLAMSDYNPSNPDFPEIIIDLAANKNTIYESKERRSSTSKLSTTYLYMTPSWGMGFMVGTTQLTGNVNNAQNEGSIRIKTGAESDESIIQPIIGSYVDSYNLEDGFKLPGSTEILPGSMKGFQRRNVAFVRMYHANNDLADFDHGLYVANRIAQNPEKFEIHPSGWVFMMDRADTDVEVYVAARFAFGTPTLGGQVKYAKDSPSDFKYKGTKIESSVKEDTLVFEVSDNAADNPIKRHASFAEFKSDILDNAFSTEQTAQDGRVRYTSSDDTSLVFSLGGVKERVNGVDAQYLIQDDPEYKAVFNVKEVASTPNPKFFIKGSVGWSGKYSIKKDNRILILDFSDPLRLVRTVDNNYNGVGFECNDGDGDGYGVGCGLGDDCGDSETDIHPGAQEACNNRDDDCNGDTDDGLGVISCGVGSCYKEVNFCEKGNQQSCTPGNPAEELCNGGDDDCDGKVDEDAFGNSLTESCVADALGACSVGKKVCTDGNFPPLCSPGIAEEETCDEVDNDCDGKTDEGCSQPPPPCTPSEEVCDGLDNDCDGKTDEDASGEQRLSRLCEYPGEPGTEGNTPCRRAKSECVSQVLGVPEWGPCLGGIDPSSELCDNSDNDCDGKTDEDGVCDDPDIPEGANVCTAPGNIAPSKDNDGILNVCIQSKDLASTLGSSLTDADVREMILLAANSWNYAGSNVQVKFKGKLSFSQEDISGCRYEQGDYQKKGCDVSILAIRCTPSDENRDPHRPLLYSYLNPTTKTIVLYGGGERRWFDENSNILSKGKVHPLYSLVQYQMGRALGLKEDACFDYKQSILTPDRIEAFRNVYGHTQTPPFFSKLSPKKILSGQVERKETLFSLKSKKTLSPETQAAFTGPASVACASFINLYQKPLKGLQAECPSFDAGVYNSELTSASGDRFSLGNALRVDDPYYIKSYSPMTVYSGGEDIVVTLAFKGKFPLADRNCDGGDPNIKAPCFDGFPGARVVSWLKKSGKYYATISLPIAGKNLPYTILPRLVFKTSGSDIIVDPCADDSSCSSLFTVASSQQKGHGPGILVPLEILAGEKTFVPFNLKDDSVPLEDLRVKVEGFNQKVFPVNLQKDDDFNAALSGDEDVSEELGQVYVTLKADRDVSFGQGSVQLYAQGKLLDSRIFNVVPVYIRGDANRDKKADLSDAVSILNYLFLGKQNAVRCEKAADVNDDEKIDISDAVYLLSHLFQGGPSPAPPYPAAGRDLTGDSSLLSCFG